MNIMFQFLKKILVFLWKQKKLLVFILFLIVLFFALRFPWNTLLEKTIKNVQKQYPSGFQADFDKLYFTFFPPGLGFSNVSLAYKKRALLLDRLQVSILFQKWLAFKKAWRFQAVRGDSFFYLDFWQKKKSSQENPEITLTNYFLKAFSPSLDLEVVKTLFSHLKMSGNVNFRFDYQGFPERIEESKASLILKGKDIQLLQTNIRTHLGSLSFPPINWKEGEISFYLKEGELVLKKFHLGSPSDDFIVQIKGSAALKYSYGSVQVESYDLKMQIDLNKQNPMKLLNLMFAGYKEDKGSFFRYKARLKGQGRQVPDMEKISTF